MNEREGGRGGARHAPLSAPAPCVSTFGVVAGFGGDRGGVASTVGIERAGQEDPVREWAGLARSGRRLASGREVAV